MLLGKSGTPMSLHRGRAVSLICQAPEGPQIRVWRCQDARGSTAVIIVAVVHTVVAITVSNGGGEVPASGE